jgi:hypothetical protein
MNKKLETCNASTENVTKTIPGKACETYSTDRKIRSVLSEMCGNECGPVVCHHLALSSIAAVTFLLGRISTRHRT